MKKTAIIIVYFGKSPIFLELFLKGCSLNKEIKFIFFTDWEYSDNQFSSNCILFPYSKDQFSQLMKERLGFFPALKNAYKLCDYKPAWPYLFEDYLKDYDYIGWCDIDLIFGRLDYFFHESLFEQNDLLTITSDYISGAFTIIKNKNEFTSLFMSAIGWKTIFQDERHYAFDENLRIEQDSGMDSFSSMIKREKDIGRVKVLPIQCAYECHPQNMRYDHGAIVENEVEYALFHYVIAKRNAFFVFPDWTIIPDQFFISKYGFSPIMKGKLPFVSLLFNTFYRKQILSNIRKKMKVIVLLVKDMDLKRIYIGLKRQLFTKQWANE